MGDKFLNHLIASVRIVVEHVIAGVKRCRIVKDVLQQKLENLRRNYLDNVTLANPHLREGRIAWAEAPSSL